VSTTIWPVVVGVGGHQQVEAEVEIRRAGRDLVGALDRLERDLEIRDHRTALLAEPGLVEPPHVPPVQQGRGAEDLVDGHDPGPADAHHVQGESLARHLQGGLGQLAVERDSPCT
jgi:hypothetical protein